MITVDIKKIEEKAIELHKNCNHLYDGNPYSLHLRLVVKEAQQFLYLLDKNDMVPDWKEKVIAACWLHDVIEDCRQTYNDVMYLAGYEVADIVYAVSNEKGKTRKERANSKYYEVIKANKYAVFVKLCDRIANAKYSKLMGSKMFDAYKNEYSDFHYELYTPEFKDIWEQLYSVLFC